MRLNSLFFIAGLSLVAFPGPLRAAEVSRDQSVLDAINRVESRYLDRDRRDPYVGYQNLMVARAKNERVGDAEMRAAEGRTGRKAVYLDKLLNLSQLNKDTVLDAYQKAEEHVLASSGPPSDRARAKLEAYSDLLKELKLTPPPFGLAHAPTPLYLPDQRPRTDIRMRTIR
jgi:hypothetical protein